MFFFLLPDEQKCPNKLEWDLTGTGLMNRLDGCIASIRVGCMLPVRYSRTLLAVFNESTWRNQRDEVECRHVMRSLIGVYVFIRGALGGAVPIYIIL